MNDWLEEIYTIFSRIGDFFNNAFHAIESGISYVSASISGILSASIPAEILGVLVLVVGVCVILLILGR